MDDARLDSDPHLLAAVVAHLGFAVRSTVATTTVEIGAFSAVARELGVSRQAVAGWWYGDRPLPARRRHQLVALLAKRRGRP